VRRLEERGTRKNGQGKAKVGLRVALGHAHCEDGQGGVGMEEVESAWPLLDARWNLESL